MKFGIDTLKKLLKQLRANARLKQTANWIAIIFVIGMLLVIAYYLMLFAVYAANVVPD